MFFMLSTICGSLANNTLLAMGDRDYLMVRVVLVSPYMNFLGRLAVKMVTDFVYFTIILNLFGVSFVHGLLLSLVTMCIRPAGEMIAVLCFDQMQSMYNNRNAFNGTVIALSVFVAYGMPLLKRQISSDWLFFIHPVQCIIYGIIHLTEKLCRRRCILKEKYKKARTSGRDGVYIVKIKKCNGVNQ